MQRLVLAFWILSTAATASSLPFPSSLPTGEFSVEPCEKAYADEPCSVAVQADGLGARTLTVAKRMTSGRVIPFRILTLWADGRLRFDLKFQESGVQNIVMWLTTPMGKIVGMDGFVIDVNPPKGTLGTQSDISYPVEPGMTWVFTDDGGNDE